MCKSLTPRQKVQVRSEECTGGYTVVCPFCEHCDTKVMDKRESDAVSTRRRRECLSCHQRFTTYERVEQPDLVVTKHDGRTETFNPDKLRKGIALAIAKRPVTGDM